MHNFSAGPSKVYKEVLQYAQKDLVDFESKGFSLLEMSHRGKVYETVHKKATELLHSLLGLDDNHHVLLLSGGASLQFSMLPFNMLPCLNDGEKEQLRKDFPVKAAYVVTGAWGQKAYKDAKKIYPYVDILYSGEEHVFTQLPVFDTLFSKSDDAYSYIHVTSNETIHGIQWQEELKLPYSIQEKNTSLVADMSSDILSRRIDVNKYNLLYAGAQKNLGVAGLTVVVVSNRILEESASKILPAYLSYDTHYTAQSLYNTPPVFAIWMLSLVLEHIVAQGGVPEIEKKNQEKATMLYNYIDETDGFYRSIVQKPYRSTMNVVFTLPDTQREQEFFTYAEQKNLYGLKGHRSVGGCRASLYNAVSLEDVEALIMCMKQFKAKN